MTEFVIIARYRARIDQVERVSIALRAMKEHTPTEPGNLSYEVLRDPLDEQVFMLFERYVDEIAFEAHKNSPHFQRWLSGVVLPALEDRVRYDLVPLAPA